eukprot:2397910-Prymnesium_polylepis.1
MMKSWVDQLRSAEAAEGGRLRSLHASLVSVGHSSPHDAHHSTGSRVASAVQMSDCASSLKLARKRPNSLTSASSCPALLLRRLIQ